MEGIREKHQWRFSWIGQRSLLVWSTPLDAVSCLDKSKIIVIKSTVLPGTTFKLQEKYIQHRFLFNPEFLTEKNAFDDLMKPDRQILGYTPQSKKTAEDILRILPRADFEKVMLATEAEMVKYFGNTFLATKVVFANQIYDLCEKLGINYEMVRKAAAADKRIGETHFDVWHEGYRGYQGWQVCYCRG